MRTWVQIIRTHFKNQMQQHAAVSPEQVGGKSWTPMAYWLARLDKMVHSGFSEGPTSNKEKVEND